MMSLWRRIWSGGYGSRDGLITLSILTATISSCRWVPDNIRVIPVTGEELPQTAATPDGEPASMPDLEPTDRKVELETTDLKRRGEEMPDFLVTSRIDTLNLSESRSYDATAEIGADNGILGTTSVSTKLPAIESAIDPDGQDAEKTANGESRTRRTWQEVSNLLYPGKEERFWDQICLSLAKGKLVVVLGHEFARVRKALPNGSPEEQPPLPKSEQGDDSEISACSEFLEEENPYEMISKRYWARLSPKAQALTNPENWPRVASLYIEQERENDAEDSEREDLVGEIERMRDPGAIYNILARLPISNFILTSPDTLLKRVLEDGDIHMNLKRLPTALVWDRTRAKGVDQNLEAGTVGNPLLFYLCGRADVTDSVLLTEEDRMAHLAYINNSFSGDGFPPKLKGYYLQADTRYLFLGWGLDQYGQRLIVRQFRPDAHCKYRPSFAIDEGFWSTSSPSWSCHIFQERFSTYVFGGGVGEFLENLEAHFRSRNPEKKVFISHSLHDREEYASPLVSYLWKQRIFPWFDQQQIAPDEKINDRIKEAIDSCDVFVSLVSDRLIRPCTYAEDERNYAAEIEKNGFTVALNFAYPHKIKPKDGGAWSGGEVIETDREWMDAVHKRIMAPSLPRFRNFNFL